MDDLGRATLARVTRRIVPFAFICYVVAYIDRVNIGFAANELQRDLGLSVAAYGIGAGLFFLGYCAFEIPSNLILERVGARRWMARIMVGWGVVSMATMFVWDTTSFYTARVLLGIAEAGFFPGIVLYLTYWIPGSQRARNNALFMTAAPIAMIVGAPVSEALLKLDGALGLQGWQWLFLIEGFPAVVLGVLALWVFTDRPEQASWLTPPQREWLTKTMDAERAARSAAHGHGSLLKSFGDSRVWVLSITYLLNTFVTYGVFLFLPKILRDASGFSGMSLSAITAIPFVVALIGMVVIGAHSDRTGERKWHVAACALTAATGLVLAVLFQDSVPLIVLSFALSQLGQRSVMSVFWSIPPMILGGTAAAAGIALINSIGNLGGFFGPTVIGSLRQGSDNYSSGLLVLAAALVLEAILVVSLKLPRGRTQAPRAAAELPVPAPLAQ
ncbi:MAG TPA: MFS transporter [Vicinamibacterales bacterium]|jgi:ACS family tartrate transporter-like MFS transporter|nr:MFS transporter [Vicinamibacterales bacterium]